jgi:glycosyltransferase involved in cell wall biosynthesis
MLFAADADAASIGRVGDRALRVLVLHSRYATGSSSGENRVVEDEVALLRSAGHEVELLSPEPDAGTTAGRVAVAASALWSRRAVAAVRAAQADFHPDVLHVHNLFPMLSPAVLRLGAPTVVTLHNYRMLCLPAVFLREGKVCEDCLGKMPWRGIVHRCYRDSFLGSATLAASLALHRGARTFDRPVKFLAVSDFVRDKYIEAGWDPGRIGVQPNFVQSTRARVGPGSHFVFVGRLSPEKGLHRLLPLWGRVDAKLIVVGDGGERSRLERVATGDVEFWGTVDPSKVPGVLSDARALVLPSICYEGAPRTVVEAFACGVPVIANAMGALPSIVTAAAGIIVDPSEPDGWVHAAARLLDDDESIRLGAGALAEWERRFSPDRALRGLETAYQTARQTAGVRPASGLRT